MANEITVTAGLSIRKRATDGTVRIDKRYSRGITDDMAGVKGPTPGAITAALDSAGGTQVDLSQLIRPGWVWIENLGPADGSAPQAADYVELGIWDPAVTAFYTLLEFWPGMGLPLYLSRNIQEIRQGPGSGTAAGGQTARLMLIAYNREQVMSVEAYEY